MNLKRIFRYYYFHEDLNIIYLNKIAKLKNISVIFDQKNNYFKLKNNLLRAISFCKKEKISYYFINDFRLAVKYKAKGVYLKSSYKLPIRRGNFNIDIIGSAHNQLEYFFKKRQQCKVIMLSPIFENMKYTKNKTLNINRFNLVANKWETEVSALGGINYSNIKKIRMTKSKGVGFSRFIETI